MSDWVAGYRAALVDLDRLALARGIALSPALIVLIADLDGDALVIEREQDNRMRRRRLGASREALPLFDELPP